MSRGQAHDWRNIMVNGTLVVSCARCHTDFRLGMMNANVCHELQRIYVTLEKFSE